MTCLVLWGNVEILTKSTHVPPLLPKMSHPFSFALLSRPPAPSPGVNCAPPFPKPVGNPERPRILKSLLNEKCLWYTVHKKK